MTDLWTTVTMARDMTPGQTVQVELPFTEVCMHLQVAGGVRKVLVLEHTAQILCDDGTPYSSPITHGEAGIYRRTGDLYTYVTERVYTGNWEQRLRRLADARQDACDYDDLRRFDLVGPAYHRLMLACGVAGMPISV